MRVLLFNTAHRWIGEAATTALLARELAALGCDVVMAVPASGQVRERAEADPPCAIEPLAWRLPKGQGQSRVAQYAAVRRLLARLRPDIIHAGRGHEHWCAAVLRPVAAPAGAIVRTRHVVRPMPASALNRWLFRSGVDAVTAISAAAMRGLGPLGCGLPATRRAVVLGAAETERFAAAARNETLRRGLGVPEPGLLVGMLARWQRIKGHDVLHDALARVCAAREDVRGVIAGRRVSLDNPKLDRMWRDSGLGGKIAYRGEMDNVEALAASFDIGVIASRGSEGFSRAAVEYMAAGVPVVATRVGALDEIVVDGRTGLIVPPENPAAMADALLALLADPDLRSQMGQAGRERARTLFAPGRMAEEMLQVYREALTARRG